MIDFNKLKMAYDLSKELSRNTYLSIYINTSSTLDQFSSTIRTDTDIWTTKNLDDLINKLCELLKQSGKKLNIGDEVYFIDCNNDVHKGIIKDEYSSRMYGIKCDAYTLLLEIPENELFTSVDDLANTQIKYWQNIKQVNEKY